MTKINIHAGDFHHGKIGRFDGKQFLLPYGKRSWWDGYPIAKIPASELETFDLASEENVKKIGGTVGWGIAGAALLGPVGLLAGLLAGGRRKEVTFVAAFKDGRRILATTNAKTFTKIQASIF